GGFSVYNAVVIGAWGTAILWSAHQLKEYFAEKSKAGTGRTPAPMPQAQAEGPKEPLPLPPGMKPMIGLKWPVKPGNRASWPKLPKEQPGVVASQPRAIQPPAENAVETSQTNSNGKKRGFVYERPTLPDRKPKLPNNWADLNKKKEKDTKRD